MEIITINGTVLPPPSRFKVVRADIDSSDTTRNEVGVLMRDRVRHGVYKLELEFNVKKGSEIALIESVITGPSFSVRFPDTTGFVTRRMYVGDRDKEVVLYKDGDFDEIRWDLSFNLIEY